MMPEMKFWELIEQSQQLASEGDFENGDEFLDLQSGHLRELLTNLSADEILDFDRRFAELSQRAYRWDLWGAAYWILGGCSDDSFMDFRATLISLGKERFDRLLRDPEALVDIVGQPNVATLGLEGFQYVPSEAYQQITGARPKDYTGYPPHRADPSGDNFDFDDTDEMRRRYPRLTAKFPHGAY